MAAERHLGDRAPVARLPLGTAVTGQEHGLRVADVRRELLHHVVGRKRLSHHDARGIATAGIVRERCHPRGEEPHGAQSCAARRRARPPDVYPPGRRRGRRAAYGAAESIRPNHRGDTHDPAHRPAADRATTAIRSRSRRRGSRPGTARRQVRRDVDVHELHLPVVQLPQPAGCAAVLRPDREHRRRGVRPHRARLGGDQHDAHGRGRRRAREVGGAEGRQGHPQHAALHRRRRRSARAGLEQPPVDGRQRLLLGRPRRGPDAQLLPRDRGAQQQAEGLRDGRASRGPRPHRVPARARRRASDRLRPRAREPHRRRT